MLAIGGSVTDPPGVTDDTTQGPAGPDQPGWAERYETGDTPWDLGGPHPELSVRLQGGRMSPPREGARALVPGAGAGHDALALARRGWLVTAVDLVDAIPTEARDRLTRLGGNYLVADVLEHTFEGRFDLIWDHTFFCAIDPSDRARWGKRAGELVVPGGHFTALVFPTKKPRESGGPPFGMEPTDLTDVLGPLFRTTESVEVQRPVARRTWRERWLDLERTRLDATH